MFVEVGLRRYKDNNQSAPLQFVYDRDRIVVVTERDRERKRLHDTR